ncbi:MAG: SDR family oxidoreductase [Proteobacteria bacterium]|nr:SDR family oxidoreductase [Pseudomonadota bacterium]
MNVAASLSSFLLEGRVALVFGAGSAGPGWGNGKAAAVTYARAGATVIAVDINPAAAEETRAIIAGEGGRAEAATCDVTRSAEVLALADGVAARHGRIDVLHNNVGITAMGGVLDESEESFRRVLDVNLTSAFLTCKHVLPHMLARGKGAVVNVSSLASLRYSYPYASYQASKAGLNQLTQSVALQFAKQGIRANAVLPGMIDTPLIHQQIAGQYDSPEAMIAQRNAKTPMGRQGTAWDVANAALFLASDAAGYITGQCLVVDGGLGSLSI